MNRAWLESVGRRHDQLQCRLPSLTYSVSLWGWYQWLFGGAGHAPLVVTRSSAADWCLGLAGWLLGFALLAYFLGRYANTDVPNIDGFLTAGSLLGQLLLSRKKLENWMVWIALDILYVGLYFYKGLYLTAILYAIFIVLAWVGLRTWGRVAHARATP